MARAATAPTLLQRSRALLPQGGMLPEDVWRRRHRAIVALLVAHAAGIALTLFPRDLPLEHKVAEAGVVALAAAFAARPELGRRYRSLIASFGLLSSSAILVHLSGGYIEFHFHFFVMIIVIALYQDWPPFLLAIAYVVLHHGIVGVLDPMSVYNHPDAWEYPWKWALIHGLFVLGASIACLVMWRLNEDAMTARVRSEREARVAAEAGLRLREEFLSIATHELRTPVASIKGYAQLALRSIGTASGAEIARVREQLVTLNAQSDRLARLVTHLLDASRIEAGKLRLEPVRDDLSVLVLRLVEMFRPQTTAHTFEVDVRPGIELLMDASRIEQVVANLVDNAIRYSPSGGRIRVAVRATRETATVEVADEGIGIAPEQVGRIFDRFYQAHSADQSGLGLGLFISREITKQHGGTLTVRSEPRRGSTFTLTIPRRLPALRDAAATAAESPAAIGPAFPVAPVVAPAAASLAEGVHGAVLVVEDDAAIAELLREYLTDEGYRVVVHGSAAAALDALRAGVPRLILLDKLLPEMDGTAFAGAYRARPGPHAPVVGICAARDGEAWSSAIGAVGFVAKPFDLADVHRAVTRFAPLHAAAAPPAPQPV